MSRNYQATCTNCGETGHSTKQCLQPVTSYGVILFRLKEPWDQAATLLASESVISGLESASASGTAIEYLLIQRKDSLGYIDILRGKYRLNDIPYITHQVRGMTRAEHTKLLTLPFDALWEDLWGPPVEGSNAYRHEKEQSRVKLEALRKGDPSLQTIIESVTTPWETPEWGFPKGRRDAHETEFACALRELWEETGLSESEVVPIRNLEPIREVFFGSNHIQYCHKYYIMYMPTVKDIALDPANAHMRREIGDLKWCTLEEGLSKIRPENVEKREVLLRVSRLLRNYCPLRTF